MRLMSCVITCLSTMASKSICVVRLFSGDAKRVRKKESMVLSENRFSLAQRAVACLVAFSVVFPFFFTIIEAEHPCTGDDNCAICQVISEAMQFEQSGFDVSNPVGFGSSFCFFLLCPIALLVLLSAPETLVHLKVRIND